MKFEKEMLVVLFAIVLIWLLVVAPAPAREGFHNMSTVSLPLGYPRYGLRGDRLHTESIDQLYLGRYPEVRLHPSNNEIYDSNVPIPAQGVIGCSPSKCPETQDGYYEGS